MYEKLRRFLLRHTPLNTPTLRRVVREAKRARRKAFEALGSDRYSHPALGDLDRKLSAFLPERGGVFVEAGAFDGYWQSNTYWFERFRGWSGVLVEPIPQLAAQARRERPHSQVFECALVAQDFPEQSVRMRFGGTMSILLSDAEGREDAIAHAEHGAYDLDVPTSTLSTVLDQAGVQQVDLLSLDVEGHEPEVLKGLDFERHAPQYILIEILDEQAGKEPIYELLEPRYELVEQLSGRDHLFRRRTPQRIGTRRLLLVDYPATSCSTSRPLPDLSSPLAAPSRFRAAPSGSYGTSIHPRVEGGFAQLAGNCSVRLRWSKNWRDDD